jgi:hypothetical protein
VLSECRLIKSTQADMSLHSGTLSWLSHSLMLRVWQGREYKSNSVISFFYLTGDQGPQFSASSSRSAIIPSILGTRVRLGGNKLLYRIKNNWEW